MTATFFLGATLRSVKIDIDFALDNQGGKETHGFARRRTASFPGAGVEQAAMQRAFQHAFIGVEVAFG